MIIYRPLFNNILVLPLPDEGIIAMPDASGKEPIRGEVIERGNGDQDTRMEPQLKDVVWFRKGDSIPVTIDGKQHFVLSQKNVILVEYVGVNKREIWQNKLGKDWKRDSI